MTKKPNPAETVDQKIKLGENLLLELASRTEDPLVPPSCLANSLSCMFHYMNHKGLDVQAYIDAALLTVADDLVRRHLFLLERQEAVA